MSGHVFSQSTGEFETFISPLSQRIFPNVTLPTECRSYYYDTAYVTPLTVTYVLPIFPTKCCLLQRHGICHPSYSDICVIPTVQWLWHSPLLQRIIPTSFSDISTDLKNPISPLVAASGRTTLMPSSLTLPQCTRSRLTYTVLTLGVPNLYNCLVQIALSRFLATLRQFTVSLPDNRYIQILIPFLPVPGPGSLTPVDPRGTVSVQMPCSDPSVSGSPRYSAA